MRILKLVLVLYLLSATISVADTFRLHQKTEKETPVASDIIGIEDSADSYNVKSVQVGNLPLSAPTKTYVDSSIPTDNSELDNGAGYLDQSTADALYSAIGSGIWGNFTGTLSDQIDLQAELDRIALIEELLGASSFTMGALNDLLIKDSVQPDDGRALILDTVVEGSDDAALHALSAEKVFDLVEYLDGRVTYLESVVGGLEGGTPDPSAPTLESVVLSTSTDHEIATLTFSEAITQGTGYNDNQLDLDASIAGDDVALTYVSGDTTDTHVYTLGTTRVTSSEIVNFDFDGTADSLEDSAGDDLAAVVSAPVTNSSSYAPAGSCEDLGDVNQPVLTSTGTISLGQYSNTGLAHAQYFVPDTNITLCGVAFQLKRPTGSGGTHSTTITAYIYSDDGGTPKANRPDTLLYSSTTTIYQDDLTTSLAYYTFDFSDVSLTSGTAYWIYIDPTGYNATDYVQLSINSSSPSAQEFHVDWDGSAWTLAQYNAVSPIKIFGK